MTDPIKRDDALLPCPFCKCEKVTTSFDHEQGLKWGYASCDGCAARGPEVRTNWDREPDAPWHSEAIAAWNTRAQPAIDPAAIREAALLEAAWCFDDDVGHPSKARDAILALQVTKQHVEPQSPAAMREAALQARIEELVKERDEARIAINQIGEAMGVLGIVQCLDDIVAEAKKRFAKLTKAMAGLRKIADHKHFSWDQGWIQNTEARIASATLAELEKTE